MGPPDGLTNPPVLNELFSNPFAGTYSQGINDAAAVHSCSIVTFDEQRDATAFFQMMSPRKRFIQGGASFE